MSLINIDFLGNLHLHLLCLEIVSVLSTRSRDPSGVNSARVIHARSVSRKRMFMSEITIEGLLTFEIHSVDPRLRLGVNSTRMRWFIDEVRYDAVHKRKQGCWLSSIYEKTLYPESLIFLASCRWFTPRRERIRRQLLPPCNFSNLDVRTVSVNHNTYATLRLPLKNAE